MAPTKKSRVNKRYGGVVSYSPEKDVGNSTKSKQRGSVSFSPDKDGGNSSRNIQRVSLDLFLWIYFYASFSILLHFIDMREL